MKPTRIYVRAIQALLAALPDTVHSICHVTGGGIVGNLNRVIAKHQQAVVTMNHEQPAVFRLIKEGGPVEQSEMLRTFNLGIGLVLCVKAGTSQAVCESLRASGEKAWTIGNVEANADATPVVVVR